MDDSRRVLAEGTVIIEDGLVVDVVAGHVDNGASIDCRGKLVLPGLVNAHVHSLQRLWRGSGANMSTFEWIRTRRYPLMAQLDDRGVRVAMRLACAEMVRSGTTAFLEPEVPAGHLPAMAAASGESGLRAGLAMSVRAGDEEPRVGFAHTRAADDTQQGAHADPIDLTSPELADVVAAWHGAGEGRVSLWIALYALRSADDVIARWIRRRADDHDLRITFHAVAFPEYTRGIEEHTGLRPAAYAKSLGLLGPKTVIGHGVHFDRDEFQLLASAGTTIAHCPSHRPAGSRIAPVPAYLRAGIGVALGTDGGTVNDHYDLLTDLRYAAMLHGSRNSDPDKITAEEILEMATRHGARGLGVGDGSLEAGQPADAAVLDLQRLRPTQNVIDSIVFAAGRDAVSTVVVGGDPILHKGSISGLDEDGLLREAEEIARETVSGANLSDEVASPWFVGRDG